jgi:YVTN family beta-propeller protein
MERIRVIVVAGCLFAVVAVVPTPSGLAAPPVQAQSVAATSTLAVITTFGVGVAPGSVAVNEGDDTVYVTNFFSNNVSVINGRTGTVAGTIPVGSGPSGVAVDQGDDTVYVTNFFSNNVSVINGRTGTVAGTITVGSNPIGVAVDQVDDTVYVTNRTSGTVSVINGRSLDDSVTIPVGSNPIRVAVNDGDDTVYVTNFSSGDVSVINGRTRTVDDTITVGDNPVGVAVDEGDDTVYVTNFGSIVWVINGRTGSVDDTITVGTRPYGVAVDQRDDTVYVTNEGSNNVSVINGRTRTVAGTITVGSSPNGVAVDDSGTNAGLVYVANTGDNTMSVIARVSASLGSMSASAGSTVTVTLDVPQVDYDVDGSTVTSVSFGGTLATGLTPGVGDAWTLTVPAGSGTVPVTVTFNGGLTASAGNFTYPPPPPVLPPSAPRDVVGVPGNREAGLSWTAPTSSGSFPISTYQAVVSPGGQSCLVAVPAVTCTISGLTNGTTYTATVRALNGAGWGPYSTASAAFTPQPSVTPSITITGTRAQVRGKPGVAVTGTTTGFDTGAILRPWIRFPGQTSYTQGTASILVDVQGGFTWQRRTGKTIYISIRSEDNTVVSNRLILRTT